MVGTTFYMAPEAVANESASYAADLWALGVIIYQMVTGDLPFKGTCASETSKAISRGTYTVPSSVPESARSLIEALLKSKPEERLGASSIADLKRHAFFAGVAFGDMKEIKVPMDLKLTKQQTIALKFLPKKKVAAQAKAKSDATRS